MDLLVIYTMFAMVVLTSAVPVGLFRSQVAAVRQRLVAATYFRIYQGVEPESTAKLVRYVA